MTTFLIVVISIVVLMAIPWKNQPKNERPQKKPTPRPFRNEDIRYGAPLDMKRTSKDGESLTQDECDFIEGRIQMNLPCCPDCESGKFLRGPEGGGSVNVKCSNKDCGSKFNMMPLGIDRISDASPDKPREMVSIGPHR